MLVSIRHQVLPFFRKAEHNERLNDEFHGSDGPMNVTEQIQHNKLSKAFVRAAQELGLSYTRLQWREPGRCGLLRRHPEKGAQGKRLHGLSRPARRRRNLTIQPHALATRVLVEDGRARGVEYTVKGKPTAAYADREVVLSGGSVNSPRLLLLSGIGPADEIAALGINTRFITCPVLVKTSRIAWMFT